eukprot:Colp12_sorted_trinity150504_noHs@25466
MAAIFSQTRLSVSAEVAFARELEKNPIYPFTRISDKKLVYQIRYKRLYLSIFAFLVSLTLSIVWIVQGKANEQYFLFFVIVVLGSAFTATTYRHTRRYVLNHETKTYTFAESRSRIFTGPFHNIYIRLCRTKSTMGQHYYYLVVNGYQMDKQILTQTSKNVEAMRSLGRKLAENLNINYFDEQNVSKHHVIRHFRPVTNAGVLSSTGDLYGSGMSSPINMNPVQADLSG